MDYKEAAAVLQNNYPDERYSMLREAVDISIKILNNLANAQGFNDLELD